MSVIKKWLLGDEKKMIRDGSVWNMIYSMEYSLLSAVLMLIITRISGLYDAGIFMIAYTVTQMMATIGSYGMRSFQVSDVRNQYSFGTYYASRIVTVVAMFVICMGYSLFHRYDIQRISIIIILCTYRLVEDVEDVFHGEMQKNMRLDIASKIAAIRIFVSAVCFTVVFVISKNLVASSLGLTLSSAIVTLIFTTAVSDQFKEISLKTQWKGVPKLLVECFPICIGGFLYNYLVNAPKYAIDRNLSEEIQTIFNILFMPIFVINMLSSFIFKPLIVRMGILWNENKKKQFVQLVFRQLIVIVGITIVIALGGAVIGLDILGWIYGVSLTEYRMLFVILILFGGLAAIASFLVVVLTVVRKQMSIIVAYILAMLVDLIFVDLLVVRYQIWGGGIMYGIAMSVVVLVLGMELMFTIGRKRRDG